MWQVVYISFCILLIGIVLGVEYLTLRRNLPAPRQLPFLLGALLIAAMGYMLKVIIGDGDLALLESVAKLEIVGYATLTPAWVTIVAQYTGHDRWATRRRFASLMIPQLVALAIAWTNEVHGWFWADHRIMFGTIPIHRVGYGTAFWVYGAYSLGLVALSCSLIVRYAFSQGALYSRQALMLLIATLLPVLAIVINWMDWLAASGLFLGIPAFIVSSMVILFGMQSHGLLDIVAVPTTAIIRSLPDNMLILDEKGRIVIANQHMQSLMHDITSNVLATRAPWLAQHLQSHPESPSELAHQGVWYEVRQVKIRQGTLIILRDITEDHHIAEQIREQEQAHLRATSQLKDEFVQTVSHDLKVPTSILAAYTRQLQRTGNITDPDDSYYLKRIVGAVQRMERLINDILDLSRLESKRALHLSPVPLKTLLDECMAYHGYFANEKSLQLLCPPTDLVLEVDQALAMEALNNIVSNAIKYTPPDGTIRMTITEDAQFVHLAIRDTGEGIPAEAIPHLFDSFYRVEGRDYSNIDSTGLGLAIVKAVMELHHGKVSVDSTVGKGSTFTISFPKNLSNLLDQSA